LLYLSTRNHQETYTAARVLAQGRAPDGGLFVPYYTAPFPKEDMEELGKMEFNDIVARLLNIQFQTRLTGNDVRLCVGKSPVRLTQLSNRILAGECWHNLRGSYTHLVHSLIRHIFPEATEDNGSWAQVGVGACVIFGIFGELMGRGLVDYDRKADVSLVGGDFSMVMSCWYARCWGLPIGNIVCCCNENNALWSLFAHGSMRTDAVSIPTPLPEADVAVPVSLERLIHGCGGTEEASAYVEKLRLGATYYPEMDILEKLRSGIYVSVVSSRRTLDTIPNVYATHGYLLSPYSALAYAGLLDFKAKKGGGRTGVVLCDRSPLLEAETVASVLDMTVGELKAKFE